MDQQVKQEQALGNAVIDTKSYLPLIAVKNGNVVTMFTDGFIFPTQTSTILFFRARMTIIFICRITYIKATASRARFIRRSHTTRQTGLTG
jgi:hypothetical protein